MYEMRDFLIADGTGIGIIALGVSYNYLRYWVTDLVLDIYSKGTTPQAALQYYETFVKSRFDKNPVTSFIDELTFIGEDLAIRRFKKVHNIQ